MPGPRPAQRPLLWALTLALVAATALPALAIEPAPDDLPQTPRVDITAQVVDLTFPVKDPDQQVSFIDDFLYLRGGGSRLHAATDVMAPKHRPVHAAVGGVISFAPYNPSPSETEEHRWSELGEPHYGWMLNIQGDDGRRYSYIHLNNDTKERDADGRWLDDDAGGLHAAFAPKIASALEAKGSTLNASDGVRVERGELLGFNGDSGNAKGVAPHLHLEIHIPDEDGSYRINPYHSLQAALERGDIPGDVTPIDQEQAAADDEDAAADDENAAADDENAATDDEGAAADQAAAAPDDEAAAANPYQDIDLAGTHTDAILALTAAGIVRECAPDRYCPHRAVTRDDIAAAFAAALGLDTAAALATRGGSGFADVPDSHPDAGVIAAVAEAGVLAGYGNGRFGPDDPLSRAQLATVLVQGFELPPAAARAPFTDVADDAVHGASIAAAHRSGLTSGCGDGTRYCGEVDVTRGQIATFLDSGLTWTAARS